jgi:hypothetical protein
MWAEVSPRKKGRAYLKNKLKAKRLEVKLK